MPGAEEVAALMKLKASVLAAAKRFGKARFAQAAASNVDQGFELPSYIANAVSWLLVT